MDFWTHLRASPWYEAKDERDLEYWKGCGAHIGGLQCRMGNTEAELLTARYCGVRPPRPVRFPQVVALLSCCICWASCCCRRRCSLSFCVSANFTTIGEEHPCWGAMVVGGRGQQRKGEGQSAPRTATTPGTTQLLLISHTRSHVDRHAHKHPHV